MPSKHLCRHESRPAATKRIKYGVSKCSRQFDNLAEKQDRLLRRITHSFLRLGIEKWYVPDVSERNTFFRAIGYNLTTAALASIYGFIPLIPHALLHNLINVC